MRDRGPLRRPVLVVALCALTLAAAAEDAAKEPLELADLMRFRQIEQPVISEDGAWVAYALVPDRGDGEVMVRAVAAEIAYSIERGSSPVISADSRWAAARLEPTLEEREREAKKNRKKKKGGGKAKADGEEDDGPRAGLALMATADGTLLTFAEVRSFAFSDDGRWLAYQRYAEKETQEEGAESEDAGPAAEEPAELTPPEGVPAAEVPPPAGERAPAAAELPGLEEPPPPGGEEPAAGAPAGEEATDPDADDGKPGTPLVLRHLESGEEIVLPHVGAWAFSPAVPHLAYAVAAPGGEGNGLFVRDLASPGGGTPLAPERALRQAAGERYPVLAWAEEAPRLAFLAVADEPGAEWQPAPATVWVWNPAQDGPATPAIASQEAPEGWFVPAENELSWTRNGERLFFGFKPLDERVEKEGENETGENADGEAAAPFDPYDLEAIREERAVDVWHGDDPLIIPNQKQAWKDEKKRVYLAVYHTGDGSIVPLADREVRLIRPNQSPHAIGLADVPYLRERTWDGFYHDVYRVDLGGGRRQLVARRLADAAGFSAGAVSLSPGGRWVAYYRTPHWYLFDGDSGETRNLTAGLPVGFADEDHDYPEPAPGYGVADWVGDHAVLIHDKFDIWRFSTAPGGAGEPERLTAGEGRRQGYRFRLLDLDPDREGVEPGEELLLGAYHDRRKQRGFYRARVGEMGVRRLLEPEAKLTFLARAEEAPRLLYTRESYSEFPDLWVADLSLEQPRRVSSANPGLDRFAWGNAELVEWESAAGVPLQGVLIKPGNYQPGERYPVIVYFYRLFSPRLFDFNEPAVNHRPSFPFYASHGYAIFLPDIRFQVGRPGASAVDALVPGVEKLVAMGVADPAAIGLHGHSWSGYQTAFVITQTDVFAAAVAGAPVSNMTSAYSGIRWGTGLARQFQYEQSQSRIGASLWQARDLYIDSSPVFFADRIETPLMLMFGDEDGAVPWYQGIELYLALRRLDKEVIFLQYRGEDHHLESYANKLDYTIRMKEFFDHYLKGEPAPDWMREGVPYRGK